MPKKAKFLKKQAISLISTELSLFAKNSLQDFFYVEGPFQTEFSPKETINANFDNKLLPIIIKSIRSKKVLILL